MIHEVMLLRHGRTTYNLQRRLQGQIDIPLDIVGQWQADQSAMELDQRLYWAKVANIASHHELLAQPGPDAARRSDAGEYDRSPAAQRRLVVLSSDLFRAQQTAHAVADPLGVPVTVDVRLRERSFGRWEGMTREEIQQMDPQAYASWKSHMGGESTYGVESKTHAGRRGLSAINDMVRQYRDDPIPTTLLLVGHGSWITSTIGVMLGIDVDTTDALGAGVRNAHWSTLVPSYRDDGTVHWKLTEYNLGPAISRTVDWENGPEWLRPEDMPLWKPWVDGEAKPAK